jgi:uncharacterized membrane protein YfcA
MIESVGLVTLGFFVGLYGTLVGIGGGPLIVPVIAMMFHYDTPTLIAISLFVIFFNTLSGSIAYIKESRVDLVSGTKFGLASVPGSLISTFAVYYIHLHVFTFFFGLLLLGLAVYIFFKPAESGAVHIAPVAIRCNGSPAKIRSYPIRGSRYSPIWGAKEQNSEEWGRTVRENITPRVIKDTVGNVYKYQVNEPLGMVITALIGIFSTFLGIGGGMIQVPVLVYLLSFPVHVATATSHYITAINTCFALIPFMVNHDIVYGPAITLSLGAVVGAQIGARLSNKVFGETLLKLLIPIFLFMGIKLLLFK